jgi:hypothetical protein
MSGRRDDHLESRDPDEWATGDEAMTAPQENYLKRLSEQAGVSMQFGLTKAQASVEIEELQEQIASGRSGRSAPVSRRPRSLG